jgi:hypothetical protein
MKELQKDAAQMTEELQEALSGLPEFAARAAERTPDFWRAQRLSIASQISSGGAAQPRWLAWTATVAASLILSVLLGRPPAPPTPNSAEAVDPDHELLLGVERSLRRSVPLALEPAALLTQELNSAASGRATP